MDYYRELPAEIRQRILNLFLLDDDVPSKQWTRDVSRLMLVNRQFFDDTKILLQIKAPIYIIGKPILNLWTTSEPQQTYYSLPQPTKICLSLFDTANTYILQDGSDVIPVTHHDLLEQWISRMPRLLPKGTTTVLVDATPAPGHIRNKHPDWVNRMVNDSRVRRFFMPRHASLVTSLVKNIPNSACGPVEIIITGTYGVRSNDWVDGIVDECAESGVKVSTRATFTRKSSTGHVTYPLNQAAACLRLPRTDMDPERNMRWLTALRKMQTVRWRQSTHDLYKSCKLIDKSVVVEALEQILYFQAESHLQTYDLAPSISLQRKLVHRLVEDLGLWTETLGEEPDKYVRLSRTPLPRLWETGPWDR